MNRQGGFTLIELMVVIFIIGVLAAISLPPFLKFIDRAWYTRALVTMRNAMNFVDDEYYTESETFPPDEIAGVVPRELRNVGRWFPEKTSTIYNAEYDWEHWSIGDTDGDGLSTCIVAFTFQGKNRQRDSPVYADPLYPLMHGYINDDYIFIGHRYDCSSAKGAIRRPEVVVP